MIRVSLMVFLVFFVSGCFAIVDHQGEVARVKTFIITDDDTLDLLERVEDKDPSQKHTLPFFKVHQ
jgi:hypothetical protein